MLSQRFFCANFHRASTEFGGQAAGEVEEGLGVGTGAEGRGLAGVAALAYALDQGYAAQQLNAELLRHAGAAVTAENEVLLVGMLLRREPRHVLNQPENGPVDTLVAEHVRPLLHIGQRHLLRRRHQQRALHRHLLQQADMDVHVRYKAFRLPNQHSE